MIFTRQVLEHVDQDGDTLCVDVSDRQDFVHVTVVQSGREASIEIPIDEYAETWLRALRADPDTTESTRDNIDISWTEPGFWIRIGEYQFTVIITLCAPNPDSIGVYVGREYVDTLFRDTLSALKELERV